MADTVTLATLVRGQIYKQFYNGSYVEFRRHVPKIVDEDLADQLEELAEEINTEEGQKIEMERFKIERGVSASKIEAEEDNQTRTRIKLVRETVPVNRKKPLKRKIPVGSGETTKPSGFRSRVAR